MTTATSTALPSPAEVRDLLESLSGRDVTVQTGARVAVDPRPGSAVATYLSDDDRLLAVAVLTTPLAGALAGALGLLPAGGVADQVADAEFGAMLVDALHEVANMLSVLLNQPGAEHVRLVDLHAPGAACPVDVGAAVAGAGVRVDLTASVPGYGEGGLAVVLV